jgi:hypothetical protein
MRPVPDGGDVVGERASPGDVIVGPDQHRLIALDPVRRGRVGVEQAIR